MIRDLQWKPGLFIVRLITTDINSCMYSKEHNLMSPVSENDHYTQILTSQSTSLRDLLLGLQTKLVKGNLESLVVHSFKEPGS